MNWQSEFESKAVASPEEAVAVVRSGDTVICGLNEPAALLRAMASRSDLADVTVLDPSPVKGAWVELTRPESRGRFTVKIGVVSPLTVEAVNSGVLEFMPVSLGGGFAVIKGAMAPDVLFIQVTPPDEDGYCNLGIICDYTKPLISYMKQCGKPVVAEVSDRLPTPMGDCRVHVNDISTFVVVPEPPSVDAKWTDPPPTGPVIDKIAEYLDPMIEDGATIQIGLGRVPGAVIRKMTHKQQLGVHTEVFGDALFTLVKSGSITNRCKTVLPEESVATILQGTAELMNWSSNNSSFSLRPSHFVLDPSVIAANYKMTAINSAIQIDLSGQICAESSGFYQLTTPGGQGALMQGACMNPEGKAIIVTESTAKGGKLSRIVNALDTGAAVTTNRVDTGYVITEYGIAKIIGRSLSERAKALISVAHPDFRDELRAQALKRNLKV
jgi:4-hydroxybutyrate CoA-transferase